MCCVCQYLDKIYDLFSNVTKRSVSINRYFLHFEKRVDGCIKSKTVLQMKQLHPFIRHVFDH